MKERESLPDYSRKRRRRAQTPEEREAQLISLAMDCVEERIRNGKASSQELVHFLRAGSNKERYEKEKLALELELVKAKTENLRMAQKNEEMYAEALRAFKRYSGTAEEDEEDVHSTRDVDNPS